MGRRHHDRKLMNISVWFGPGFHGSPDPTRTLQCGFPFRKWGNRGSKEFNWPKISQLGGAEMKFKPSSFSPYLYPSIVFYNSMLRIFIFSFSAHILIGYYIFFPQNFYKLDRNRPRIRHTQEWVNYKDRSDVKSLWKYKTQMPVSLK